MKEKLLSGLTILFFFILPSFSIAQPITEYQQFNGRYDFTAIGNTLNEAENASGYCGILTSSSADLNLLTGQTLIAAYLYWAGSGDGDFEVVLNGVEITAERTFSAVNGPVSYFGAFANVTSLVQLTGNGNYTLSELDLTAIISNYCAGAPGNGTNFGGWSITVVYEDLSLPNNQLTIYDGLQKVFGPDPILNINLTNLNVVDVIGAKVGFLVWEGDAGIAVGETLSINGVVMEDPPLNPANNAFNSTNSYTGAVDLWNMDLDLYSIEDVINIGDTSMLVQLDTNQDGIFVNNINVVLSSELPDATIVVDNVAVVCDSRDIEVDYTVFNLNSTDIIPAGTPIAFYADGSLVGNSSTLADIAINGSESNTLVLTIPLAIPNDFTLTAVVDDIGDGTGILAETNETNNDFDIEVTLIENPIAFPVSTIIVCDLNNDGFATFFLPVSEIELLGTQTDITVTYYLTLADAEAGINEILNPEAYVNVDTPFQTIFVRLENDINGCFVTSSFLIEVRPVDFLPFTLNDLEFCLDGPSDIGHPIDLTVQEATIFGGGDPSDYTVTYHLSQLDAAAGVDPFPDPTAYPNIINPQVIWVRLVNNVINCVEIGSFTLQIYINPFVTEPVNMTDYELCDDEIADGFTEFDLITKIPEITGSNPNVNTSFHLTQLDANNGDNPLPLTDYTNTSNPQTIYVRVTDINNGCVVFTNFDLVVNPNPELFPPDPLTYCDPDNDGFGSFVLTDANNQITGGDPNLFVTYHETFTNAQNNVLPLPIPYTNIVIYNQTVFARVVNVSTGCISIIELVLEVLDSPQLVDPDPLVLCDENNNGTAVFDLTLAEAQIFSNIPDPTQYTINYYETQANANSGTNPIVPATAYPNASNPQTIYIVVEDINNGCQSQTTLELIVEDLPVLTFPVVLELCDINNPGDEVEEFDLEQATLMITNGDISIVVTYHESLADAQAGVGALTSPYSNTANPQNLWVRAQDSTTGCIVSDNTMTLTLIVNPLPSPATPEPLEVCDPDSDGFSEFDLDSTIAEILGGEPDVTITFHETLLDAQEGLFALASPYFNIVQFQQVVYARAENIITGCYRVVELLLIVNNTPEVPLDLEDLVVCSEDQTDVGIIFDLTQQEEAIYGDQDPTLFTLSYHLTQGDAESGTNAIVNPENYPNTTNPQTIWVRLEDDTTECFTIGSFELLVNQAPEIAQPADLPALELCDDEVDDGFTEFDLTVMNPLITLGQVGMEVQYYLSLVDAQAQLDQIDPDTAFTNTVNPQNIWVRVYDADTDCDAYTRITLRVLPNPSPNDPDPIAFCDTNGTGFQVFDLTIRELQILGGEPGVSISYYETLAAAEQGDPLSAIPDPENYTNIDTPQQIIYVRVENDITGCYTIVELLLIIDSLPELIVADYIICELNTDGIAIFDLTTKITEILSTQGPGDYQVTFHEVAGDELVPQNAIPQANLATYQNQSNPQTLYVRVSNSETDCFVTGNFDLEVREGATATAPAAPLEACEDVEGSGIGTFDLTQLDAGILNGQAPPVYVLTYHESQEDAEAGINAIPPAGQTAYQSPTQTLWARVTNTNTDCYEIVEIQLIVNPLPVLVAFQESYRLCVDEFGNVIPEEFGATSPPVIDTGLSTDDYSFTWFVDGVEQPEQGGSIVVTQGGVYSVVVVDLITGCENTASTTVTVSSPPFTYSALAVNGAFAGTHAIEVTATGLGSYVYQLDDGPFQESTIFNNVTPGSHTITITDENGCGSVTIEVSIIDYPLFFTPNNDGYHDTWNIIGIASNPTAKIYIFDRHGKLLKQVSPTSAGWDGTYNGRPLPSSDYWFRVEYKEDDLQKEFRGHFTLKR